MSSSTYTIVLYSVMYFRNFWHTLVCNLRKFQMQSKMVKRTFIMCVDRWCGGGAQKCVSTQPISLSDWKFYEKIERSPKDTNFCATYNVISPKHDALCLQASVHNGLQIKYEIINSFGNFEIWQIIPKLNACNSVLGIFSWNVSTMV